MCGIAGFIGRKKISSERIERTLGRMVRRGPDGAKVARFERGGTHVDLLHSRLSIIDLDGRADQPFSLGRFTMVFNGEIYNYLELRKELEGLGDQFKTSSDTEVLLAAYARFGEAMHEKLEGMWALAIYDKEAGSLFLSRDRFAEKPLFVHETSDGLYFASEIKFLRSLSDRPISVNQNQVLRFIINGYKSLQKSGETFYLGVRELGFASFARVSWANGLRMQETRFWNPAFNPSAAMSEEEAIAGFRQRLLDSVKVRLRSDVPLAFCLSGGIDSSAITSIAAKEFNYKVHAFSIIDSDERYNEEANIMATVRDLGCQVTAIRLKQEADFSRLRDLVSYHDAPVYTISYFVHSFLSKSMHEQGYKVAFSGTAADELVTGYYDHYNLYLAEVHGSSKYKQALADWNKWVEPVVRNPYLRQPELYVNNPAERSHIYLNNDVFAKLLRVPFREEFEEKEFTSSRLRNRMLNELFYEATPVVLHEDDLNSMRFSIENRSPFLDRHLFEFAYQIPNHLLIKDGFNKYILRESMKGILNDQVRLDRQKKGFNASIRTLFDFENSAIKEELYGESAIYDLFDRDEFIRMVQSQDEVIENSVGKFLFYFISAKLFLDHQADWA